MSERSAADTHAGLLRAVDLYAKGESFPVLGVLVTDCRNRMASRYDEAFLKRVCDRLAVFPVGNRTAFQMRELWKCRLPLAGICASQRDHGRGDDSGHGPRSERRRATAHTLGMRRPPCAGDACLSNRGHALLVPVRVARLQALMAAPRIEPEGAMSISKELANRTWQSTLKRSRATDPVQGL